jgi:hypothetical protein
VGHWRCVVACRGDVVLVVHLAFVAFVVFGGFLAWRWPRVAATRPCARAFAERGAPAVTRVSKAAHEIANYVVQPGPSEHLLL